jgi:hypothetical protein
MRGTHISEYAGVTNTEQIEAGEKFEIYYACWEKSRWFLGQL